jgi:hypothetical protein
MTKLMVIVLGAAGVTSLLLFAKNDKLSAMETVRQTEDYVKHSATAEVQVAPPIDFGVLIPKGAAVLSYEFYAKNGAEPGGGWLKCDTSGAVPRCGRPVPAGFDNNLTKTVETYEGTVIQSRIVNDRGTVVRARIVVWYLFPVAKNPSVPKGAKGL